MDRLQQKNEFFVKLGALFGPLQRLAGSPESYDEQERTEIIARYCAEYPRLKDQFRTFSQSLPGHDYVIQYQRFQEALDTTMYDLKADKQELGDILCRGLTQAKAAIAAIPIPRDATIQEAQTPFSTYCKLKDLVEADATSSLVWIDAYMASSIFSRFLRNVRSAISVTLVTCEPKPTAGKRDQNRWTSFLDVSRLYALECGATRYRLVVHGGLLHDRWLLLDNKRLYALGGSAKDAGDKQYFTIARLDASPENVKKIQAHVNTGTEYFGVNTPQHL